MGLLDIIILVVLGLYILHGFRVGLARQLAALLGTLLGLAAAFAYYHPVAVALEKYFHLGTYLQHALSRGAAVLPGISELVLNIISLVLLYVAVSLLLNYAGVMAAQIVQAVHLSLLDRCGGAALGLAKGIILCSIALRLANLLALPGVEAAVAKSRYAGTLEIVTERAFQQMESMVPEGFRPERSEPITKEI